MHGRGSPLHEQSVLAAWPCCVPQIMGTRATSLPASLDTSCQWHSQRVPGPPAERCVTVQGQSKAGLTVLGLGKGDRFRYVGSEEPVAPGSGRC